MVKAKNIRPASTKKKRVAKPVRRITQRKVKNKPQREMPSWGWYIVVGLVACLFLIAF